MAKDTKFDRYQAAQDLTFNRQPSGWHTQYQTWQQSQAHQAVARQACQPTRPNNGLRIDQFSTQPKSAFQKMKSACEQTALARNQWNALAVQQLTNVDRYYKTETQGYLTERRRWAEEIRSTRSRQDPAQPAFQQLQDGFGTTNKATADDQKTQAKIKSTESDFKHIKIVLQERLEMLNNELQRRQAGLCGSDYHESC